MTTTSKLTAALSVLCSLTLVEYQNKAKEHHLNEAHRELAGRRIGELSGLGKVLSHATEEGHSVKLLEALAETILQYSSELLSAFPAGASNGQ